VITVAGRRFRVVGEVANATILAGIPSLFMTLPDAQLLAFGNTNSASAIAVRGHPAGARITGLEWMSNRDGVSDLERPLRAAQRAIAFLSVLLYLVAALIVGSMVYLSALERQRDFAVLKATGLSTRSILGGLASQAVLVAVAASVVALAMSVVMVPLFPLRVVISDTARALLPAAGVIVGLAASGLAVRRATSVDPALAFAGP
jgi:putative ABC transport system permease protein